MSCLKTLILGGTGEASQLAALLAGDARFAPLLSLAGRTQAPRLPDIPWRTGGFGGAAGLAAYLAARRVQALVVATHPFAANIRANAVAAAGRSQTPLLLILRPPWQAAAGDDWSQVADMAQAARALGAVRKRVFLTVGRQELAPFAAAPWHDYLIRSVDPPPPEALPPRARVISARGPFSEAQDYQLLREARIEILVSKNAGGAATQGKLLAARALGLPVVLVARPPEPDLAGLAHATTADALGALAWLVQLHAADSPACRGV